MWQHVEANEAAPVLHVQRDVGEILCLEPLRYPINMTSE